MPINGCGRSRASYRRRSVHPISRVSTLIGEIRKTSGVKMPRKPTRYRARPDRAGRIKTIKRDLEIVLSSPFSSKFRARMVSQLIWDLTEVDAKFGCRYRSKGVIEIKERESIQHEHVFTRRRMVEAIS
jgi:hypothetical protein